MPPLWEGANIVIQSIDTSKPTHGAQGRLLFEKNPIPNRAPRRPTIRFFVPDGMSKPEIYCSEKAAISKSSYNNGEMERLEGRR